MREILFRGKRVDNGGWIEGSLIKWKHFNGKNYEDTYSIKDLYCNEFLVHLETVGQFTGLLDKNGKRIFEGDVVISGFGIYDNPVPVFWDNELFMWSVPDYDYTDEMPPLHALYLYNSNVEIIGNIHDSADNLSTH